MPLIERGALFCYDSHHGPHYMSLVIINLFVLILVINICCLIAIK